MRTGTGWGPDTALDVQARIGKNRGMAGLDETFPAVGACEDGQKLLRLLARRLGLPEPLLHRWIRTGQIRVNGKRARPFDLVHTGDALRIPPFAGKLNHPARGDIPDPPTSNDSWGNLPPLAGAFEAIWAFNKPAGLAVQNGTGHADSLCARLACAYAGHRFVPAPAHRLDCQTSGILLAGASFASLQKLQTWFRNGEIHKEYLAWLAGTWPFAGQKLLRHYLVGKDQVLACAEPAPGSKEALCKILPLLTRNGRSLVQIQLLTGRRRQLRAQLAALGLPIHGDDRYGASKGSRLKLHSLRVALPNGIEFSCLPPWTGPFRVTSLPPAMADLQTRPIPQK